MIPLWGRLVNDGTVFNLIALDHSDVVEVIGEHSRGHQSRYATIDHHSLLT
jgi:hypothetical protein